MAKTSFKKIKPKIYNNNTISKFMLQKISNNVTAIHFNQFGSIVYFVKINNKNILIDTSSEENAKELINSLKELNITREDIKTIILTHSHYDHIENIELFSHAKIYGNFTKKIKRDHSQKEIKNILNIESQPIKEFKIFKLPGQSDIAILYKDILFSGDIIFHGGYIGRNDFPESDIKLQQNSLEKLSKINFNILAPGH